MKIFRFEFLYNDSYFSIFVVISGEKGTMDKASEMITNNFTLLSESDISTNYDLNTKADCNEKAEIEAYEDITFKNNEINFPSGFCNYTKDYDALILDNKLILDELTNYL